MGTVGAARVDATAVRAIAREYDAVSSIVDDAVRQHFGDMDFGGAAAGRAYAERGETLRATVADLAVGLREWARAATEIAVALRASADRYRDADERSAGRVG